MGLHLLAMAQGVWVRIHVESICLQPKQSERRLVLPAVTQAVGKEIGAASSYGGEDCGRHHEEQGCYAFFLMLLYVLSI